MPESVESLRKSLGIYRGLVEVSGLIASITDYRELLRAILEVARKVVAAEAASLFLLDAETGALELTISSRADGEFMEKPIVVPKGRGIAGWVMEHGEAELVEDAYSDPRFYRQADLETGFHTRSILCAPLKRDGQIIGVLQVLNPIGKAAFEAEDLDGFRAYSNLTATAIEKLRALERLRQQERVERDLAIASEIQRELLAGAIPPRVEGARFAAFNAAAANVGGDFYDVFTKAPGKIFFALGDVSGKGIPAALLMAQTLSAMEFVFRGAAGPAAVLEAVNLHLNERIVRGMFVTALVGLLDTKSGRVTLASAGHLPPLLVRDGTALPLRVAPALPLGILPEVRYQELELGLEPGSWLVAFSDGLTESRPPGGGDFEGRIPAEAVAGVAGGAQGIVDRLVEAERAHRGDHPQRDDLTVLVGGLA